MAAREHLLARKRANNSVDGFHLLPSRLKSSPGDRKTPSACLIRRQLKLSPGRCFAMKLRCIADSLIDPLCKLRAGHGEWISLH